MKMHTFVDTHRCDISKLTGKNEEKKCQPNKECSSDHRSERINMVAKYKIFVNVA